MVSVRTTERTRLRLPQAAHRAAQGRAGLWGGVRPSPGGAANGYPSSRDQPEPQGALRGLTGTARARRPRSRHYPPPPGRRRPRSRHYPDCRAADVRAPVTTPPPDRRRPRSRRPAADAGPPRALAGVWRSRPLAGWRLRIGRSAANRSCFAAAQRPDGAGSRADCRKSSREPEAECRAAETRKSSPGGGLVRVNWLGGRSHPAGPTQHGPPERGGPHRGAGRRPHE